MEDAGNKLDTRNMATSLRFFVMLAAVVANGVYALPQRTRIESYPNPLLPSEEVPAAPSPSEPCAPVDASQPNVLGVFLQLPSHEQPPPLQDPHPSLQPRGHQGTQRTRTGSRSKLVMSTCYNKDQKRDQDKKQEDKTIEIREDKPSKRPGDGVGDVAARMCESYAKLSRRRLQASLLLLDEDDPIDVHVAGCNPHSTLIVGGQNVSTQEFPHMAAIGFRYDGEFGWLCGGTLISEWYVLTAAHCTHTAWGSPKMVRLGTPFLKARAQPTESGVNVKVAKFSVHPGYVPPARYHDIALLKLARAAPTSASLRPACLPPPGNELQADSPVVATGWGHLTWGGNGSDILQKVSLRISTTTECSRFYNGAQGTAGLDHGVGPGMLCAGHKDPNKDTCQGDSGGPLQVPLPDNQCAFRVVGITSFGTGCGLGAPAVYTKVARYVQWIEEVVWPR